MTRRPLKQPAHVERLSVSLALAGPAVPVGTLAWSRADRRAYFEYDPAFLAAPLPLAPFRLPARAGLIAAPYEPFGGLHGLFNDSLPDGWGRKLLDRRLQALEWDLASLTPLDRLAYVGEAGMGALRYVPDRSWPANSADQADLDFLATQAELVQAEATADIDLLSAAQGGSAGARPKVMVAISADGESLVTDAGQPLPAGFEPWLVKFRGSDDPAEIGAEEYAYSLMAQEAGIAMPSTRLLVTARGGRYFAVQRFDRCAGGRLHVQTASGLLEADHRTPSLDYATLLKMTTLLTRDGRATKQMFRRMVFNVLAHNRDDHAKNHAFLMAADGMWHPTPAYDLTFSTGPGGEHSLAVAGEGRAPSEAHMLKVAADAAISRAEASDVITHVRLTIDRWPHFADQAGLPQRRINSVDKVLNGTRARTSSAKNPQKRS